MATSEELLFILRMRDEASAILKHYEGGLKQTAGSAGEAEKSLQDFQHAARDVAIALGAVVAQTATWRATVGVFGEYESGMLGVAKTTGLAGREFDRFTEQFDVMAAEMTLPIDNLQEIAQVAGQVGVTGADNILNFTRNLAMLSDASDVVGSEGAEAVARLLNVTEEGVENVGNVAAALVALGNNSAATESKILRVATVIGQSLSSFNIASHEVLGLATSVAEVGQAGELAGTTFFKAFRNLQDAALKGGEQIETLAVLTGRSMEDIKKTILENPVEGFQIFIEAMARVRKETGSTTAFLEQFNLKGAENARVLDPLVEQVERLAKNLGLSSTEFVRAQAHVEEYNRAAEGLERQQQRLTNVLELAGKTIGADVAPTIKAAIEVIAAAVLGLTEAYQSLPDAVQTALSHIVVFGPSVVALAGSVKVLTTAFKLLRIAMVGTPWGAAFAAASLLVTGLSLLAAGTSEAEAATARHEAAIVAVNEVLGLGEKATKEQVEQTRALTEAELEAAQAALAHAEARLQAVPVDPTGEFGFFGDVAVAEREAKVLRERIAELQASLKELGKVQAEIRAKSGEVQGPPLPPAPSVPTVTGEHKAFIDDVEERIQVLQTEAQKLREGSYAFEQYQAAQQTKGEIDKLVEDAKELGVNVDDLARRLKAAAEARQATEAEIERSTFRDDLERTIAELDKEAEAILAGTRAYEQYQQAREIDDAVADLTEEAENLGFVRGEVQRLAAEYRAAAKARQDALAQQERAEFQDDLDDQLAAMDAEIVALGQGAEAYEDYKKQRQIDAEVDAIVEQAEALGYERDAALAAGEGYRRRAEQIDAGLEKLEEAKKREEEARRLARELATEFTRTASSMIVDAQDTASPAPMKGVPPTRVALRQD
jgi:TP901 family phage tail tape measure protein